MCTYWIMKIDLQEIHSAVTLFRQNLINIINIISNRRVTFWNTLNSNHRVKLFIVIPLRIAHKGAGAKKYLNLSPTLRIVKELFSRPDVLCMYIYIYTVCSLRESEFFTWRKLYGRSDTPFRVNIQSDSCLTFYYTHSLCQFFD